MTIPQTQENQEFVQDISRRAFQDSAFKARLLSNPYETLKELNPKFGIPAGMELVVQDQSDSKKMFLNLSKNGLETEDIELTEEELELVSGGSWDFCLFSNNDTTDSGNNNGTGNGNGSDNDVDVITTQG